jgi:hypothetical protein
MIKDKEARRRRRTGLLLGLPAVLGVSVLVGANLAPAAGTPPLRVNATATTVTLTAGDTATYDVKLTRGSERGVVAFTAADLPPAATASFSPASTTRDGSTLTITTDGDGRDGTFTPAGDYAIVVRATGPDAVAGAVVRLKVQSRPIPATGSPVRVSGTLDTVLRPGVGGGLNLSLSNPNSAAVRVSAISVRFTDLRAPNATPARPCTFADFEIVAYAGPAFTLTPNATRTLSQLRVPAAQWPQVRMRDTALNQDGCQGATVNFTYGAEGRSA